MIPALIVAIGDVHGHTPQKGGRPAATENRLSMDTGAVFTGRLGAAIIDPAVGLLECVCAERNGSVFAVEPRRDDRGSGTFLDT